MNKIITTNYVRITKKQAERLYKTKQEFYMCPCKVNPENPYGLFCCICPGNDEYTEKTFETLLNEFHFYNSNYEIGYYPAFYMSRKEYEERANRAFI